MMIALALGWYLLLAPGARALPLEGVGIGEPLRHWAAVAAYDSAAECERARRRWADRTLHELRAYMEEHRTEPAFAKTAMNNIVSLPDMVLCVASDDPRLR